MELVLKGVTSVIHGFRVAAATPDQLEAAPHRGSSEPDIDDLLSTRESHENILPRLDELPQAVLRSLPNTPRRETELTDPSYTAIQMILDRSGSMNAILGATEEAINGYVREQEKLPGRVTIAISQFDDEYSVVNHSLTPGKVPPYRLAPRGSTALLDAIGRGATEFGEELSRLPESRRPGTVILVIVTDGYENASREYSLAQIKGLLTRQQEVYRWEVLYLAANQDAIAEGAKMGMRPNSSITYRSTSEGTRSVIASASVYTASAARGQSAAFTPEQRDEALTGKKQTSK